MEYLILGFFTGLSLILAIGAQNIFVIEQGLKKQHIFLVCSICSISDLILIFTGIFLFHYFNQYFNSTIELIFNILLIIFLLHFIFAKIKSVVWYCTFSKSAISLLVTSNEKYSMISNLISDSPPSFLACLRIFIWPAPDEQYLIQKLTTTNLPSDGALSNNS